MCALGASLAALADAPMFVKDGKGPVPLQKTPAGVTHQSAQACGACHSEIVEEWRNTMHSSAWNDPHFQELWRAQRKPAQCLNCHSPMAAQQPLIGGKPNAAFEPTIQAEGVTCSACHVRDGHIVGRGTSVTKLPHPVKKDPSMGQSSYCAGCHQQAIAGRKKGLYDTFAEWQGSPQAKAGLTCQECHMPMRHGNVATGVFRPYRSHSFAGGHTDDMLKRALTVTVQLDKPVYEPGDPISAVVRVKNTGAGHHVPSGDPLHQVRLVAGLADGTGAFLERRETVFARKMPRTPPYREHSDTRLAAGQERTIKLDLAYPGGLGEHYIIVQLSYHVIPPEVARELNIPSDVTGRVFSSQVIPITD